MEIRINKEKIKQETGLNEMSETDYLNYMYNLLYSLTTHNKNYTKEQEYEIYTLKSIIENMEVA